MTKKKLFCEQKTHSKLNANGNIIEMENKIYINKAYDEAMLSN